jgi:hypothetical protein
MVPRRVCVWGGGGLSAGAVLCASGLTLTLTLTLWLWNSGGADGSIFGFADSRIRVPTSQQALFSEAAGGPLSAASVFVANCRCVAQEDDGFDDDDSMAELRQDLSRSGVVVTEPDPAGACRVWKGMFGWACLRTPGGKGAHAVVQLLFTFQTTVLNCFFLSCLGFACPLGHGCSRLLHSPTPPPSRTPSLTGDCGLHVLVREGGRSVIQLFISWVERLSPLDIDHRDGRGTTLLHAMCGRPSWGVTAVRHLLELGASVNAQDLGGRTPLHVLMETARDGNCEVRACVCVGLPFVAPPSYPSPPLLTNSHSSCHAPSQSPFTPSTLVLCFRGLSL